MCTTLKDLLITKKCMAGWPFSSKMDPVKCFVLGATSVLS